MESVPNLISYLHEFFWIFSQFLAIYFELFSSGSKFNSEIADMRGPPVSRRFPCPRRAIKAPIGNAVLTAPFRCLSRAVALPCRARARPDRDVSRVRSQPRRCPCAPPLLSGRLHRHKLLHGERNPEPPLLLLFLRGLLSRASSPLHPDAGLPLAAGALTSSENAAANPVSAPSPSARNSDELSPPPTCPAGGLSAVDPRAPPLAPPPHCSTAADRAATCARRAVTASVCARAPRRVVTARAGRGQLGKPWMLERLPLLHLCHSSAAAGYAATRARRSVTALVCARAPRRAGQGWPGKTWATCAAPTGRAGIVDVGHALLCNWAEQVFGPVAFDYIFRFSEYIQFLANSKICVGFI
jgi:hypothetical protein